MSWLRKIPGWLLQGMKFLLLALVIAWGSLALYFSPLPWPELRIALGVAFAAFGVWAVWFTRRPRMRWVVCGAVSGPARRLELHPALA